MSHEFVRGQSVTSATPARRITEKCRHRLNTVLILDQRLRRWSNIETALGLMRQNLARDVSFVLPNEGRLAYGDWTQQWSALHPPPPCMQRNTNTRRTRQLALYHSNKRSPSGRWRSRRVWSWTNERCPSGRSVNGFIPLHDHWSKDTPTDHCWPWLCPLYNWCGWVIFSMDFLSNFVLLSS